MGYIEHTPEPVTAASKIKEALNSFYVNIALYPIGFITFFLILGVILRRISRKVHAHRGVRRSTRR